jgi:hypothetical protein
MQNWNTLKFRDIQFYILHFTFCIIDTNQLPIGVIIHLKQPYV